MPHASREKTIEVPTRGNPGNTTKLRVRLCDLNHPWQGDYQLLALSIKKEFGDGILEIVDLTKEETKELIENLSGLLAQWRKKLGEK